MKESEERLGKDQSYSLDSNKIRDVFSWKESKSLDDGIEETIDWIYENLDILKDLPHKYIHKS